MSENEIRVLYVQPGKYPEERTIPNTLRALQELVGGDIECCRPWRDSVCVICNDSGKIDGLPPNRLYGHTDFLAGSFVVCGNGGEDFISLTDRQVFLYERLYHIQKGRPDSGGVHPDPMPVCRVRSKKKISLPTRQPLGQGKNPEYDMEKGNDDACQQREIQPLASKTALQLKT